MTCYLSGQTIVKMGWAGPQAVYVDYISDYTTGFHWQLYANRKLVGITSSQSQRRIFGQVIPSPVPHPLTLIRVDASDRRTDFGALLPGGPFTRYSLQWVSPALAVNTDHFDVIGPSGPGVSPSLTNVLGQVPYIGAGSYSFALRPLTQSGNWTFGIVPRDNSFPIGNAGTQSNITIAVTVMPPDIQQDSKGNRFDLRVTSGVLTVSFAY